MAAQLWPAFVGGMYKARSSSFAADQAVNVFTETRRVPGSPKQQTLYGTPGLKLEATVATRGCRGRFSQDGRSFVVVGDVLYERSSYAVYTSLGTIAQDGNPVSFASNGEGGDQLGIVGGGNLYVLDLTTNTLSTTVLPFSDPVMITFMDGYGLINQKDSLVVWFTNLFDFTVVDALDFITRSGTSDNVVGIAVSRDRVWFLGSKTTTTYYNSGDADTPFLPYPGTTIQTGLLSPWLLGLYNDVLYWVADSAGGGRRVVAASEPGVEEISTPPIDAWLESASTLVDGRMLVYEQDQHIFILVTLPHASGEIKTYGYDRREELWHSRAGWDDVNGAYTQWRVAGSTAIGSTVLVGDYETGDLYTLDMNTYTDNGEILKRERTAPYPSADAEWMFVDQFELGMQPGVGLSSGQGSDPVVNLEISRDGGHTFVDAGDASLGAIGEYTTRAIWRRLGRFRGDRAVFRVTQTDPVKCVWGPGVWMTAQGGTGQL